MRCIYCVCSVNIVCVCEYETYVHRVVFVLGYVYCMYVWGIYVRVCIGCYSDGSGGMCGGICVQ